MSAASPFVDDRGEDHQGHANGGCIFAMVALAAFWGLVIGLFLVWHA